MDNINKMIWGQPQKGRKKKQENIFGGSLVDIGFSSSKKKEVERDTRRTFSQTQKNEIWDRQKGKCAGSHCEHKPLLRSATHYDHIIPWEKGGKTVVSNGQALCPTCHTLKSQKDRLKKVDKQRKSKKGNQNLFGGSIFGQTQKSSKKSKNDLNNLIWNS
jgi:hypothetical protein